MTTGPKLSIILPCYNEGSTLTRCLEKYRRTFADTKGVELVLVNNGSTDNTAEQLRAEQAHSNPFVLKTVTVPKNIGYGHGILMGLENAVGEFLAWSHSDLQCSPEDVLHLYRAVLAKPSPENCFGKGFRINDRGKAAIFTQMQTFLSGMILGHSLKEINAQPKLFHRSFLKQFKHPPMGFELDVYAYYKAMHSQMDIVTVDVIFHKREAGKSKWAYSLFSRIRFMIDNFVYLLRLRLSGNKI